MNSHRHLFEGENQGRVIRKILDEAVPVPSTVVPGLPKALDEAVMRGLDRDVTKRWQTARDFAAALERCSPASSATEVGNWVEAMGGTALGERAERVKDIESSDMISRSDRTAQTLVDKVERAERFVSSATVPAAFAVLSTPIDPPLGENALVTSAPPASGPGPSSSKPVVLAASPVAPLSSASLKAASAAKPETPQSSPRVALRPAMAQLDVQMVAVTPLASLEAAAARRTGSRKMLVLGITLAIAGIIAVAGAITWTLMHR